MYNLCRYQGLLDYYLTSCRDPFLAVEVSDTTGDATSANAGNKKNKDAFLNWWMKYETGTQVWVSIATFAA